MTTTEEFAHLKVTGRPGLLAAVPALLGFHPAESLVLICLTGARRRVGPVMRVDLAGDQPGLAGCLAEHAGQYADDVVLIAYSESADLPPLVEQVLCELDAVQVPVMDAMVVRGRLAHPLGSGPPIPVPGAEDEASQQLSAALAIEGRAILPDREALVRSVAAPAGHAAEEAFATFDEVAGELAELLEVTAPGAPDPLITLAHRTARDAMTELLDLGAPTLINRVRLALLATDIKVRDELVRLAFSESDEPWLPMLISAVTTVPDPQATELCAVLAMLAYRQGDGALAQVVCDRVLSVEPHHRLIGILLQAMWAGLPPWIFAGLAEELGHDRLDSPPPDRRSAGRRVPVSPGRAGARRRRSSPRRGKRR